MSLRLDSKLPDVGTTIFSVMSGLAAQHQALNLSQGYPDFDGPEALLDRVTHYMTHGFNQYPPMIGVDSLRHAVSDKVADLYGAQVDGDTEVTISAGATEALFCAIAAVVRPGDEVIVFDPAYDSYAPVVALQGGHTIHIPLSAPDFQIDWNQVAAKVSDKTRLIIINTPHNPTGAVCGEADIAALRELAQKHNFYILADEVYEHIVFDGQAHRSMCRYPDLYERSFVVSSFGKTYHVTGWKVGYCVAPPDLSAEFRRIHQFVNFTVNTPVQLGLADFLNTHPQHHRQLPDFYQRKRDYFLGQLQGSKFTWQPSAGTYFQLLDYSALSAAQDVELAKRWTEQLKLASIPVSVFYEDRSCAPKSLLRFCFAKDDATLARAGEILCSL